MEKQTIYTLWKTLISRKSVGTALTYEESLKRFQQDNGAKVSFEEITPVFVDKWRSKMLRKISKTSTNIHLRSFSAVLHYAFECQLIQTPPKFLFRGLNIFSPYSSNSRKHYYISRSEWYRLWKFYETEGMEVAQSRLWERSFRNRQLEALGLMLFMYLANGMNLRDVCLLKYDQFYFQTAGRQLRFCRHKTAERTGNTIELPILAEMQLIIDRIGQLPQKGKLVFPYLNGIVGDELKEHKRTASLGHLIRDRMQNIGEVLQMSSIPTPTWARHSFATNLTHAGVPKDYLNSATL